MKPGNKGVVFCIANYAISLAILQLAPLLKWLNLVPFWSVPYYYYKRDETIRGHVFCSFLALVLRKALNDRLAAKGYVLEWANIIPARRFSRYLRSAGFCTNASAAP